MSSELNNTSLKKHQGVTIDVLTAICEANTPMGCRFTVLPSEACFDTDGEGNVIVGPALASGQVDGCVSWFKTPARERLGAEFGHGYSSGSIPQLIASDGNTAFDDLGAEGSLDDADVAFFAGFFSDAACLSTRYTDFQAVLFSSDPAGRESDAGCAAGREHRSGLLGQSGHRTRRNAPGWRTDRGVRTG